MFKHLLLCAALTTPALAGGIINSQSEYGTPEEAQAMLTRAIGAVKADKTAAINRFNHNDPSFRDRDLFVFCFNSRDGKLTAHEAFVGSDVRALVDRAGKHFGGEMFAAPADGHLTEVAYLSTVPGKFSQAPKRAYVARIGDQVCGVSAYLLKNPEEPTQCGACNEAP